MHLLSFAISANGLKVLFRMGDIPHPPLYQSLAAPPSVSIPGCTLLCIPLYQSLAAPPSVSIQRRVQPGIDTEGGAARGWGCSQGLIQRGVQPGVDTEGGAARD